MIKGILQKMPTTGLNPVQYTLLIGTEAVALNPLLGKNISLEHTGNIFCTACGNRTNKSFNQGYCYPCFTSLAQCDMCIMKPELCSYDQGNCREPEWGEKHCMIPHTVYLANSSDLKVGITRSNQRQTRWRDQGASQAIVLGEVATRLESGMVEIAIKKHISDRTNWRKMLKNEFTELDMQEQKEKMLAYWPSQVPRLNITPENEKALKIDYPALEFPTKITSLNFDKTPQITGKLLAIKGQYLILDTGVLNIRKFGGYEVLFNH
jgi:hypothetical protein